MQRLIHYQSQLSAAGWLFAYLHQHNPYCMAVGNSKSRRELLRKSVLLFVASVLLVGLIMFVPAGITWRRGWLFFFVFYFFAFLSAWYLWRVNPEIFFARSKVHPGTKSWDKVLMTLLLASLLAIFLVAAIDARFGWSTVSTTFVALGYFLFTLGFVATTWVYAVNKFAEPSVRIQTERGQTVIDSGPYAYVRHPLYAASVVLFIGMALAMGSYWALIPVAFGFLVIVVRVVLEDRLLENELHGYHDYASRVRSRLIPGIW
jgi:protein-S-isoprenylcysteine O-methyltransferase Ste14